MGELLGHPTLHTPAVRLAEIRQENLGGDVSSADIDWLLRVASKALYVIERPDGVNLRALRREAGSA